MAYIIIPMNYYGDGSMSLSMNGEQSGYEARKILSTDIREYGICTDNISFSFPYVNNSVKRALLTIGGPITYLQDYAASYYNIIPTAIYGTSKILRTYNQSGSTKNRIIGTVGNKLNHFCYGAFIQLPDSKLNIGRETTYSMPKSELGFNLNGNIYYAGWQNNGIKRAATISFEYLTGGEKDQIINYFKLGRGVLPIWFLDDLNDENNWLLCKWTNLKITEPYVNYFTVVISMKEF